MPSYTYTGDNVSISLRGVTFPHGEPVEIEDVEFQAKLDALAYFASDKPKPEPDMVPVAAAPVMPTREQMEWTGLNYIADRMALNHGATNNGELFNAIIDAIRRQVASEVKPEVIETPAEDAPEADEDANIPSDWREMHWKRQMVLAKQFTDQEIVNGGDAVAVIELELERRGLNT